MNTLFGRWKVEDGIAIKDGLRGALDILKNHDLNHPNLEGEFDPPDRKLVWTIMVNLSPEEEDAVRKALIEVRDHKVSDLEAENEALRAQLRLYECDTTDCDACTYWDSCTKPIRKRAKGGK